jgi:alanyl-tRNA synthetase
VDAGVIVSIAGVSRNRSVFVHSGQIERGSVAVGDLLTARVDAACRRRAQANHTATHLLQAALKQIVDPAIGQAGSLVDFDRLRFDFHCPRAVTPAELEQIEALINGWISEAHSLEVQEMAIEAAKAAGAVAMFGEKYAEVVRVVDVPGVSMELCGGTHVANTAEIVERVSQLADELKATQKALAAARGELAAAKAAALAAQAQAVGSGPDGFPFRVLVARLDGVDGPGLQTAAQGLADQLGDGAAVVLGGLPDPADLGKLILVAAFGKAVIAAGPKAGAFIGGIAKLCGGGGGGRPNLAQAGGRDGAGLDGALAQARQELRRALGG